MKHTQKHAWNMGAGGCTILTITANGCYWKSESAPEYKNAVTRKEAADMLKEVRDAGFDVVTLHGRC